MRIAITLLCLSLSLNFGFSQNNAVRGIVKLQNSGAQPLANVKISSFGANPVYSNSSGMYEMVFNGKKPGSSVSLLVQLDGYEVINDKELERCVIRENPDNLVFIIMAKQGERNKQALAYYNIIVSNTNNSFNKELKDIKGRLAALDEDDKDRQILRSQIEALQKEKEALVDQAEELAKQLARVDLDRASGIALEAYEKFKAGDVKAALVVLDDASLDQSLKEAQAEKMNLETKLLKADSALQQSIENFMIKARFCISDGQYEKAFTNYLKAIKADSTKVSNLWEMADYCANMKQQDRAITYYLKAMEYTSSIPAKIELLNSLAQQYKYDGNYEEAEASLIKSLELAKELDVINPERDRIDMAQVKNSWGLLYLELQDYPKAKVSFQEALDIIIPLAATDSIKYQPDLANVYRNIGVVYAKSNEYVIGEDHYLKALASYKQLAERDPQTYERPLILIQEDLASIYSNLNEVAKAEEIFLNVLDTYKRLTEKNPVQYEEYIAAVQTSLFILYSRNRELPKAEEAINEAFEIYSRIAEENPERYDYYKARVLGDMALLHWNKGDLEKTKEYFLRSLAISTPLAEDNPKVYQVMVARMKSNLAVTYRYLGDLTKAEATYNEVLNIYKPLVEKDPRTYQLRMCFPLVNIADLKQILLEKEADRKYQDEGIAILNEVTELLSIYDAQMRDVQALNAEVERLNAYFTSLTDQDYLVFNEINRVMAIEERIKGDDSIDPILTRKTESLPIIESALISFSGNQKLNSFSAEYYGNLCWSLAEAGLFAEAEKYALKGLSIDESQEWIKSNLAPVLLHQGKYAEAESIYLELKDKPQRNGTYKNIFIGDLRTLEDKGFHHDDVSKIRAILEKE